MMEIKIFWKENCPNCPKAKELGAKLEKDFNVKYYNIGEIEGLTEAVSFGVMSTPSIVVAKDSEEIKSWRAEVPELTEIQAVIESSKE